MNSKKILAAAIIVIMILGTFSVILPRAHAQVQPWTVTPFSGAPGTTVTIAPTGTTPAFTPFYEVFALLDTSVADTDQGLALIIFVGTGVAVGDEAYVDLDASATYTAGEPIYRVGPGSLLTGTVEATDVRLTVVTVFATVYAAGSQVVPGDLDIGNAYTAFAANEMHVDPNGNLIYDSTPPNAFQPEEIIRDLDANAIITPGDMRLNYPSVSVAPSGAQSPVGVPSVVYAFNTLVAPNVFDYEEGLYQAANPAGTVTAGDTRVRQYVAPDVTYRAGSIVDAADVEVVAALASVPFITTAGMAGGDEAYVDRDLSGGYTPLDAVYTGIGNAPPGVVNVGDLRASYVYDQFTGGYFLPGTFVALGDFDVGWILSQFLTVGVAPAPPYEEYYDLDTSGSFTFGDWIYLVAATTVIAAGDFRLTDAPVSDSFAAAGALWAGAGAVNFDTTQAQPFIPAIPVATNDEDVGFQLVPIPVDMRYSGAAGYVPADPIYMDNDHSLSTTVGDTRLTVVSTGDIAYTPPWPGAPVLAPGAWYMPGSTLDAASTDLGLVLNTFDPVANPTDPNAFSENILPDGDYSTELMPVHYIADFAGWMGPFPLPIAGYGAHIPMVFTTPSLMPTGLHEILLTTDESPGPGFAAPWDNIGFLEVAGAPAYPGIGLKNNMDPLAWGSGTAPGVNAFDWITMATMAGPVLPPFLATASVQVFLHPGVADPYKPGWSHTLDTYWGTQARLAFGDPSAGGPGVSNSNWGPVTNRQTRELFDHYLDYAVLASSSDSVGDLQFDITVLAPVHFIQIFIPGETPNGHGDGFRWLAPSRDEAVWTDITDDYEFIWTATRSAYDIIDPYSIRLTIGADDWSANTLTIVPGTYHIRLFDLAAPMVAGMYHFKIYVDGVSIGAGNYPIMIVKSELNPAWVSVDVRAHLQFLPAVISGQVLAAGTTPEGRTVYAAAWWGPMEWIGLSLVPGQMGNIYRVFIFGLAEGTYTLTAQGSGYNPTVSDRITVLAGQSYHMSLVIFDSPNFHITVWSKHGTGTIPWHNLWQLPFGTNDPYIAPNNLLPWRDMTIELYDSSNNMVGWWTSNTLVGFGDYKRVAETNKFLGFHDDAGCVPDLDNFNGWLTDNWDLLGAPRGMISLNPSTHWDGHVPWDLPDYIAGLPQGQYSVESFVTGYIMDEADAYQRSFAVSGIAIALQMDLRRSNWIETVMYLPDNVFLSTADTTVTLTAEDSGANERASAGLSVSWAVQISPAVVAAGSMHRIDAWWAGLMPNAILHDGGIVIEGWNAIYPCAGGGRAPFRDTQTHDYGLNPTKPGIDIYVEDGILKTDGNPYTIRLYMSDMGIPYLTDATILHSTQFVGTVRGTGFYSILGADPQVSIFLCNSAQAMSFSIVNAWLWISMRSVDFEVPAHSRPWTFPGSAMWVEFLDASGADAGVLDPTLYGLIQDAGRTNAFLPGTAGNPAGLGFPIIGAAATSRGVSPFDIDDANDPGFHEHVGVFFYGDDWCSTTLGGAWGWPFGLLSAWRSTRLPPGQYTYDVHTHGYVMRRSYPVQVPQTQGADIEADLIQGGQIRVIMDFWHEAQATAFNGFIRVEVFDANDNLVGASIYGQAQPNTWVEAVAGIGAGYLMYDPTVDWMGGSLGLNPGPAQAHDFGLPAAIFPSSVPPPAGGFRGQRGFWSWLFFGVPAWKWWPNTMLANLPWPATCPSDANRFLIPVGQGQAVDVYGFYWYYGDKARTWAGGWPTVSTYAGGTAYTDAKWDSGIKGTVDIAGWSGSGGGLYSVKVWAFDPRGPNNAYEAALPTDDWRMYAMGWELSNIQVPWGGAQSLYIAMNDMASLRGTVEWVDMFGNARPMAWAMISATNPDTVAYTSGNGGIGAGASDPSGAYIMWLPAGTHDVSVSTSEAPQIWSSSVADGTQNSAFTLTVSDGWQGGSLTRLGHQTGVPVPEFPAFLMPLGLIAALAASVWLLRKRSIINVPVLTN